MRLFTLILTVCLLPGLVKTQNLVPNGDFETYSSCPSTYGQLDLATPWNKPNAGSTDYFNACAPGITPVSVPAHFGNGYQHPRSGDGYVGFTTYKSSYPDFREYLQTPLSQPLLASGCYAFSMYLNTKNTARFATDRIGVHFRQGPKIGITPTVLNASAHIESPAGIILNDTFNWTPVQGYYNAIGGEDHLIIGSFHPDAGASLVERMPGSLEDYAYYYVDDVYLAIVDYRLELGPDTLLCEGETLHIDISFPEASYLWSDGDTLSWKVISSPGIYSVTVHPGQCQPISDSIRVSFVRPPRVSLGNDTIVCIGAPYALNVAVPYGQYLWQDGSIDPVYKIEEEGLYSVEVSNICGTDQDSIFIGLTECENLLFAPNAFTPNGDGINDYFHIRGAGIESYTLIIFDRWGKQVFHSDEMEKPWDGTLGGKAMPSGIYHWVAYYVGGGKTLLEKEQRKSGHVLLLR